MLQFDIKEGRRNVWKGLTHRYVLALSLVAMLVIAGQSMVYKVLEEKKSDAHLINVAGRQRMLSQRLVKSALAIKYLGDEGKSPSEFKARFAEVLEEWQAAANGLRYGDASLNLSGENSETVDRLFETMEVEYQAMVSAGQVILATNDMDDCVSAINILLRNESTYLIGMNSIVEQYAREAEAKIDTLYKIEYAILGVTLFVLLLEGLLVFRPAASKIKESITELEQAGETLSMANVALDKARKEALAASEVKSQFLSVVGHEFRTPMNGIIGMASLMADTELDEEQSEYLELMQTSSDELLGIINDVLDFTSMETGNVVLKKSAFDLHESIKQTLARLSSKAVDKGLDFSHHIYKEVPRVVVGDESRIVQVMTNLTNNAIKFTHKGFVIVTIGVTDTEDRLFIEVKDSGTGISDIELEQLFTPFMQVDGSLTRKYGGTGLGLSIVRNLALLMDGDITVDSKPGAGATFRFTFAVDIQENQMHTPLIHSRR